MATFYWVGGSGNWDATTTTNWASSSGGAGGAGVPTSTDDVVFDANSDGGGTFTVTVTGTDTAPAVCQDFTASSLSNAMTLTWANAQDTLEIYGSLSLPATNFTWTGITSAVCKFRATTTGKTITTNGVTLTSTVVRFDGVGGEWTLGSALTITVHNVGIAAGSFVSGNYNMSWPAINLISDSTEAMSVDLGSSTVTVTSTTPINFGNTINFTFNAGTSTITCSTASLTFTGGGQTFYNVTFSSTASGTTTINGDNTFNDLIFTSRSATGIRVITLGGGQTVNGVLTFGTGNTNIRKMQVGSNVVGAQRTFTANGSLSSLNDVSFRDIAAAGTVSTPWTGTRIGSGGNLSNITADAPKNVYRVGTGGWVANQWSLSSGGAVNLDNFPLPQDAIIFDNNTTSGTHTMDGIWWFGSLDCSAVTSAITIANSNFSPQWHGDMTLDSDITLTATGGAWFFAKPSGGGAQVITPAGVTFAAGLTFASPAGVQFAADITTDRTATLTSGTLDLNDFDLTCLIFTSNNANTRSIDFATSSEINVTGNNTTIFFCGTGTGYSYTGTPKVNFTYSGSTGTRIITGISEAFGGTESKVFNYYITAGSDVVSLPSIFPEDIRLFGTVNFTGFSGALASSTGKRIIYGDMVVSSGMTLDASDYGFEFAATSGTQEITTAGKTFDFPVTVNAPGATVQLQDALTMGSTRTLTLTAGTFDANDYAISTGLFASSGATSRSLLMGSETWTIVGDGTAWDITDGTNLTLNAETSTISMEGTTDQTFAGGNKTYNELNAGGTGSLTISGANTFDDITNSVEPVTVIFPASTVTSVRNFSLEGDSGSLVSLRSSEFGTRFTLTYAPSVIPTTTPKVVTKYISVEDSTATGATWFAAVTYGGVDDGNNDGWEFALKQDFSAHFAIPISF